MASPPLKAPLNNMQLDILRLFSRDLDEHDLLAIKRLIVNYLAEKVTKMADDLWETNQWTDEDMDDLLFRNERTPYSPRANALK